jgi:hypothetical protein
VIQLDKLSVHTKERWIHPALFFWALIFSMSNKLQSVGSGWRFLGANAAPAAAI